MLRPNDEDYLPELRKYNPGRKFVFWSQAILAAVMFITGTGLWEPGLTYLENLFGFTVSIEQKRWAAVIHATAAVSTIAIGSSTSTQL